MLLCYCVSTGLCCIHLSVRRGLHQEAEYCTWDPTSSHDLRKWEWGAHRDGQRASEWREQTAPGHRQAPGPHTCHRRLCYPGGSWAVSCVCKCPISDLTAVKHDKQPTATTLSSAHACRELSVGKHKPSVATSSDSSQLLFDSVINYSEVGLCSCEAVQMDEGVCEMSCTL